MARESKTDWDLAKSLFCRGMAPKDIAAAVGCKLPALRQQRRRHKWNALKTQVALLTSPSDTAKELPKAETTGEREDSPDGDSGDRGMVAPVRALEVELRFLGIVESDSIPRQFRERFEADPFPEDEADAEVLIWCNRMLRLLGVLRQWRINHAKHLRMHGFVKGCDCHHCAGRRNGLHGLHGSSVEYSCTPAIQPQPPDGPLTLAEQAAMIIAAENGAETPAA